MRHTLLSLLVLCGVAVTSGCHNPVSDAIHNLEHKILYHPAPHSKETYPPDGAGFDDVWFASQDGTRLHGWLLACPQPKAVVLYAHGNAGNISSLRFPLEQLRSRYDLTVMAFDSTLKIGKYRGPLLQSHGDADRLIPYVQGQRLFASAPGPKRFITIPGGDHNSEQTSEYFRALDEFIASLPRSV
jgi:pimeloyl-ACP methyl ester carboxylesterase